MNLILHSNIKRLLGGLDSILPPADLEAAFALLASEHPELRKKCLGLSAKGHPIYLYSWGQGSIPVLWYGFPNAGEGVGGTGIYALVRGLLQGETWLTDLPMSWHFIPCLNFDDQPDDGKALARGHKRKQDEVDWYLNQSRSETTALVKLFEQLKPVLTFPLHDEYHCHEDLPVSFPVQPPLPTTLCERLRNFALAYSFQIDSGHDHAQMGKGFFDMAHHEEFPHTTFSVASRHGQVFIAEPGWQARQAPLKPVAFQLACCLEVLQSLLLKSTYPAQRHESTEDFLT